MDSRFRGNDGSWGAADLSASAAVQCQAISASYLMQHFHITDRAFRRRESGCIATAAIFASTLTGIVVTAGSIPAGVGIDPGNKLIGRVPSDNRRKVLLCVAFAAGAVGAQG